MRIGELEVELLVGGEPAKEYTDDDFEQEPIQRAMSKYVEAVEDVNFAFRCTIHRSYKFTKNVDYLAFEYLVDGVKVTASAAAKRDHKKGQGLIRHRNGYISKHEGLLREEKFRFGKIETYGRAIAVQGIKARVLTFHTDASIEKAEAERQKREFEQLGELQIQVWRNAGTLIEKLTPLPRIDKDLSNIHEKVVSQTAVSMGAKYLSSVVIRMLANELTGRIRLKNGRLTACGQASL